MLLFVEHCMIHLSVCVWLRVRLQLPHHAVPSISSGDHCLWSAVHGPPPQPRGERVRYVVRRGGPLFK